MHFCRQCDNMYYVTLSEEDSNVLNYYCRNCGCTESNMVSNVLTTQLNQSVQEFSHIINKYTKLDPTLPRINTVLCPNPDCATNRSATRERGSQNEEKREDQDQGQDEEREIIYIRYDDTNMKYVYLCSTCDTVWKTEDHS